jgi:glycosyltransferase involved in cell wall biosynthesis
VYRGIRQFGPQVLHIHTAHIAAPLIVGRRLGVSACIVSRRVSFPLKSGFFSRWKYGGLPHRVIAVSETIARGLEEQGVPREKVRVVHSGFDQDRFRDLPSLEEARQRLGWDHDSPVLLFVGALAPHKSIPLLLTVFQSLLQHIPHAKLVLAGDGPMRRQLDIEVDRHGLSERVEFLGYREDVPLLIVASDLLVLPSTEGEGSPAVIKEAMACRRPVVAASHGGIEEIVEDGVTGFLVPPHDATALAETLRRLLEDRSLRKKVGDQAARDVIRFEVSRLVEATEAIYQEIVHGG